MFAPKSVILNGSWRVLPNAVEGKEQKSADFIEARTLEEIRRPFVIAR